MKSKLILALFVVASISLSADARLISFFPSELQFGSVAVGDTGWVDVRFRYSGPDSGFANVELNGGIFHRFGCYRLRTEASAVYAAMDSLYYAVIRYRHDFGEDASSVEELIEESYLVFSDSVLRQWSFSLIGHNPVTQIEAVSTREMPHGAGHVVLFDFHSGKFSGWGFEIDGEFELTHMEVLTVRFWFVPLTDDQYLDTLTMFTRFGNSGGFEEQSIPCSGQGRLGIDKEFEPLPGTLDIINAFPNPFNASTNIAIALPSRSEIRLSILGLDGREVAVLKEGTLVEGDHSYTWNAYDNPAGTYYIRLLSGNRQTLKQILLIR